MERFPGPSSAAAEGLERAGKLAQIPLRGSTIQAALPILADCEVADFIGSMWSSP